MGLKIRLVKSFIALNADDNIVGERKRSFIGENIKEETQEESEDKM